MKPKQLICQACGHDHAQNERTHCDRSDLEIAYDALLADAMKLRAALDESFKSQQELRDKLIRAKSALMRAQEILKIKRIICVQVDDTLEELNFNITKQKEVE